MNFIRAMKNLLLLTTTEVCWTAKYEYDDYNQAVPARFSLLSQSSFGCRKKHDFEVLGGSQWKLTCENGLVSLYLSGLSFCTKNQRINFY